MPWGLRDLVHCLLNNRQGIIMMIKHRKKGRLGDFDKRSKMYDIRFSDGSILINVEEGSLVEVTDKVERWPQGPSEQYSWVRVGDVILCEKGLGIIRYVGELPGSQNTWMGMELKDDDTSSFAVGKGQKVAAPYFLGTPQDFRDEMKLERDVLESHNGYYKGKKYYNCPRGMGYWLRDKDIHKVYSPEEVLMQLGWLNLRMEELQAEIRAREKTRTLKPKRLVSQIRPKPAVRAKKPTKPPQYGMLSVKKRHNRKQSIQEISYKKRARSRFELMSSFTNEDKKFLSKLKEVVNEDS
jgi:hypothetical protein